MYIDYTPEQEALRDELRAYFGRLVTPEYQAELGETEGGGPLYTKALRQLGADGWLGVGWPREYGGQGRTPIEQFVFFDEASRAGVMLPMLTINAAPDPDDDYPVIARALGEALRSGEVERGIFCCGSGIGPAVALNKMPGIRASIVDNEWSARDAVTHVDVNVITLGERVIGDELAKSCVDAFLEAKPEGGRHERRRKQIAEMDRVRSGV